MVSKDVQMVEDLVHYRDRLLEERRRLTVEIDAEVEAQEEKIGQMLKDDPPTPSTEWIP